jgi:hypothetical protein
MGEMAEDRVYDERRAETVAYVASGQGVARVRVASDRVGRFSLAHRCAARDVAGADGTVYVATDEGVLAGPDEWTPLDFPGSAVAVAAGEDVLAADESGAVYRHGDGAWTRLGTVAEVRALSESFVAAADGVHRVEGDGLAPVGLDDARDVAAGGTVLAATGDGLYRLGNGWLDEHAGAFETVGADGGPTGDDGGVRAHAATADALYEYVDGDWDAVALPVEESVVGVAYGECPYAVTADGTFLVEARPEQTPDGTGGWRSRALGLPDVAGVAVV